ncbi:MAG: hypothetical protein QW597_07065 [Thermoplasmataceae archaeon]
MVIRDKELYAGRLTYLLYLISALAIFFIVNVSTGTLSFAFRSAISPFDQDTLFPLTYSLAILSFFLSIYWFRHFQLLSLPYATGVPFLWVIFFEILWQNSFAISGAFTDNLTSEVILLSWLLVGFLSFPTWKLDKVTMVAFLLFLMGWMAWLGDGYPQMPSARGYIFNITLKIGAFLVIIALVTPRRSEIRPYKQNN